MLEEHRRLLTVGHYRVLNAVGQYQTLINGCLNCLSTFGFPRSRRRYRTPADLIAHFTPQDIRESVMDCVKF